MPSSKELNPTSSPFFPHIFFKNQFRTETVWPPKDTSLTGKVAIVTGANNGLGLETCRQLLSLGLSRLILAVRSSSKGEAAASDLRSKYPEAVLLVNQLDMSSYDSIRAFITQMKQLDRLDIAILNAGVRKQTFETVPDTGHEETIQVNYISTILLSILLLPILKRSSLQGPGRLTIISTGLAFVSKFLPRESGPLLPLFDIRANFDGMERYTTSKLLGMMFFWKLTDSVSEKDVIVNLVDPGFVNGTNFGMEGMSSIKSTLFSIWKRIVARSLDVGASTYIDAAILKGEESHGSYIMSYKIHPYPGLLYTPEGKQIMELLWQETLAELSFVDAQGTVNSLRDGD